MRKQTPRGDEGMICPFHRLPMAEVCHKCPLWVEVQGKHPQTDENVDRWDCSIAFVPMLLIYNAREVADGVKATLSFRNMVAEQESVRRQEVLGYERESNHQALKPPSR